MGQFISQGNRWASCGPLSPQLLLDRILSKMERAAFLDKDRNAFDIARDELAMFASAHISPGQSSLWRDLGMTRQQAAVCDLMFGKLNKAVRTEEFMNALYFDRPDGGPSAKVVQVRICQIRPKLETSPYAIETVVGCGYRMVMKPDANRMAA